jgi:hypothetical protein
VTVLQGLLLVVNFGFAGGGFVSNCPHIHHIWVVWWEAQPHPGVCTGPAPASMVCIIAVVVVLGLDWCEDISKGMLAHPAAVLFLHGGLPFLEGI